MPVPTGGFGWVIGDQHEVARVGISLVGLAAGAWWAILSAATVLLVLLRISGVGPMDDHLEQSRGAAYAHCVRTTSRFIPRPRSAKPCDRTRSDGATTDGHQRRHKRAAPLAGADCPEAPD
ncbi:MAG: hypothetical protein ACRD0U_09960 [Acidimicrobiales bacterium]